MQAPKPEPDLRVILIMVITEEAGKLSQRKRNRERNRRKAMKETYREREKEREEKRGEEKKESGARGKRAKCSQVQGMARMKMKVVIGVASGHWRDWLDPSGAVVGDIALLN